jgi:hypothetical protein
MGAPGVWHFYLRRLHSLTGIFPIGVFLVEHFFGNAFATRGPEAYNRYVEFLLGMPYLPALEIGLVFGPLLFHGICSWSSPRADILHRTGAGGALSQCGLPAPAVTGDPPARVHRLSRVEHPVQSSSSGSMWITPTWPAHRPTYEKVVYIVGILRLLPLRPRALHIA